MRFHLPSKKPVPSVQQPLVRRNEQFCLKISTT